MRFLAADNLRQAVDLRFGLRNALLPQGETDQIGRCLDELDPCGKGPGHLAEIQLDGDLRQSGDAEDGGLTGLGYP